MQNFFEILPEKSGTAIALGYFDGLHKGHRNVISLAAAEKENGLTPVCFTFSKSPKSVLYGTQSNAQALLCGRGEVCFATARMARSREIEETILYFTHWVKLSSVVV